MRFEVISGQLAQVSGEVVVLGLLQGTQSL